MAIKDILFFDYKAILFGLLGFKTAGGTSEQFIFKSLKKKDCLNIRQWLIDNGANFSNENSNNKDTFEHSGFHPLSKESLTILDTAIAHHRKTFFTNRDSVVPFDKVDFLITENVYVSINSLLLVSFHIQHMTVFLIPQLKRLSRL